MEKGHEASDLPVTVVSRVGTYTSFSPRIIAQIYLIDELFRPQSID